MKDDFEFPTCTVAVQPDNSRTLEDDAKTSVGGKGLPCLLQDLFSSNMTC